jgi:tetratricopeptide (TPR) repeat protein
MKLTLALLLVLAAAPARAAEPQNPRAVEEARTRFQAGVQLFHEGSFDAALAEFRKAYSLAPSYRVLYNIAQVQFELHDYVEALKTFRQYLQEGGADVAPDRRAQVEGEVQKLERRVSLVEIIVDVDGAELLLDDVPVGTSPPRVPIMVNAGNRRITATKPGRVTTARALTVAGGDRVTVELKLPEVAVARPIEGLVPVAPLPQAERPRTKMWVALAVTTALGIGAGTFALLTQQSKKDFESQLNTFPNSKENIDAARDKMARNAAITDGLAGATVLAGGLTLYFAFSHPDDEPEPRRAQVRVLPTPGGVVVAGRF